MDPDRLVLTNGLDEGILLASIAYLVPRAPRGLVELGAPDVAPSGTPEVVVALPTFEPYLHAAKAMGARVVSVPAAPDYAFPVDAMLRAVTPNTRIVYVNNPNNPDGTAGRRRTPSAASRARPGTPSCSSTRRITTSCRENFLAEAADYPNVIVGRTFSKAFGLAGMRVGVLDRVARHARAGPPGACRCSTSTSSRSTALRAAIADPAFRAWYLDQAAAVQGAGLRRVRAARPALLEERGQLRADRRRRTGRRRSSPA